jgi:sugar O-acyltransferase (sialic acid O-acetyltransferase NeuD family)
VTRRQLVVIGGGEHAGVVVDAARTQPDLWELIGFSDPDPRSDAEKRLGIPWLGDDRVVLARLDESGPDVARLVLGIGGPVAARRAAVEAFGTATWAVIVHAAAWVSPSATLGDGAVVLAGAVVNASATIGRHAIVNSRAVVEHDVEMGDFAHAGPGAVIGGGARIGRDSFIGLGALVRDHLVVGPGATVGMGAVVVDEVPAGTTVAGSPARPIRSALAEIESATPVTADRA